MADLPLYASAIKCEEKTMMGHSRPSTFSIPIDSPYSVLGELTHHQALQIASIGFPDEGRVTFVTAESNTLNLSLFPLTLRRLRRQ
jgi:hypothetical protein